MRCSRWADELRHDSDRKSSSDFSLRRRGSVANLSAAVDVALAAAASNVIGPTLVLMITLSVAVVGPLRFFGSVPDDTGTADVTLTPIDGHRPSSIVGVHPVTDRPRGTDGVRA